MGQSLSLTNQGKNNFTLVRICLALTVLTGHGIALLTTKDNLYVSIASGIAVYSFLGMSGFRTKEDAKADRTRRESEAKEVKICIQIKGNYFRLLSYLIQK